MFESALDRFGAASEDIRNAAAFAIGKSFSSTLTFLYQELT